MTCPQCNSPESQVLDSRDVPDSIRRRRECLHCKCRFTTYERIELPAVLVIKKNGDKERFDPEKIRRGVRTSCKNRPVTSAQIDDLVRQVSQSILFSTKEEVSSREVGLLVQKCLEKLDSVAYLRFSSVYQSFTNLDAFEQAIHNLQ